MAELQYKTTIPVDSSHLKVILLIYAYLSDIEMPNQEYIVDAKTVFDQALRILQVCKFYPFGYVPNTSYIY